MFPRQEPPTLRGVFLFGDMMSKTTEKWKNEKGIMSVEEALDRLNELQAIDLDDFYTDGRIDPEKVIKNGVTHLLKSAIFEDGQLVECEIRNDYSGYVYLITSEVGLTKIGLTDDVQKRFGSIDSCSPCRIELHHCQFVQDTNRLERLLHQHFASKRVKGEWFNLDADEIQQAKEIIDSHQWNNQIENH